MTPGQSESVREALPYQKRVINWLMECFSMEICRDTVERNHRFLEESLELVQSLGCTASEAHQLVDYVYGRPVGEPEQEAGGVMVTLVALCFAADLDAQECGEKELARIWTKIDKIRAKQAAKPKHSPLPAAPPQAGDAVRADANPLPWRSDIRSDHVAIFDRDHIHVAAVYGRHRKHAEANAAMILDGLATLQPTPSRADVIEECAKVADNAAQSDEAYAAKYPDEAVKFKQRAHRARTIAAAIRSLAEREAK